MRSPRGQRPGVGILSFGAAACVVCCAGPILAFVGGLTLAGLAGVLNGVAGFVAVAAALGVLAVRRRGAGDCSTKVPVAIGPRRGAKSGCEAGG